jgi:hypothetical protein
MFPKAMMGELTALGPVKVGGKREGTVQAIHEGVQN